MPGTSRARIRLTALIATVFSVALAVVFGAAPAQAALDDNYNTNGGRPDSSVVQIQLSNGGTKWGFWEDADSSCSDGDGVRFREYVSGTSGASFGVIRLCLNNIVGDDARVLTEDGPQPEYVSIRQRFIGYQGLAPNATDDHQIRSNHSCRIDFTQTRNWNSTKTVTFNGQYHYELLGSTGISCSDEMDWSVTNLTYRGASSGVTRMVLPDRSIAKANVD